MYAPPSDRTHLLLAQLARMQGLRGERPAGAFDAQLASVRNEVAHYAPASMSAGAGSGLHRKRSLHAGPGA